MVNIKEIRAAAEAVKVWGNCNKAWLDSSDDETAAIVGAVCEEGVRYPVATVDCDQYDHGGDSLPLAKFYATANPATIIALLDRLEAAEKALAEPAVEPYDHGPQAETVAEALRDVAKWLNERPNRPIDLRHVAMICAALAEPAVEPFGYFRADPFGWTDCAPTDEGAKALYEAPPPAQPVVQHLPADDTEGGAL